MRNRRLHRSFVAVVASTAVIGLSACTGSDSESSSDTTSAAGSTTSSATTGATGGGYDKAEAAAVLLTDSDVPGYTAVPDAQVADELASSAGTVDQALALIKVEPASCEAGFKTELATASNLAKAVEQSAIRLFLKSSASSLVETIMPAGLAPDVAATKQYLEQCQQMTISAGGAGGTATVEPVAVDLGDEAVGSVITLEMTVGGQAQTIVVGNTLIKDGDVAIGIAAMDYSGVSAQEVAATLTDTTTKAYAKAEPILE